jgi:hypothetical protein
MISAANIKVSAIFIRPIIDVANSVARKVNHPEPFIRFGGFFNVCSIEYIAARWLVAPMN